MYLQGSKLWFVNYNDYFNNRDILKDYGILYILGRITLDYDDKGRYAYYAQLDDEDIIIIKILLSSLEDA